MRLARREQKPSAAPPATCTSHHRSCAASTGPSTTLRQRIASGAQSASRSRRANMSTRGASQLYAIAPPIEPMLAKLADERPRAGDSLFEPKWDGFRALVFRGERELFIQSRDSRPLDRYFPELHDALLERLPEGCV